MLTYLLIPVILLAIALFSYTVMDETIHRYPFLSLLTAFVFFGSLITSLAATISVPFYYGAGLKADLINAEYGTSYTREQMFFASDIIDTVREIKRQRVELNGNLMQQEND